MGVGVLVVITVPGDTSQFEVFMAANSALVEELSDKAKAAGCRSHRFAVGDGEVIAVDEWDSPQQFEAFMATPEIQAVMAEMGAQGQPKVTIATAKGFPGEF